MSITSVGEGWTAGRVLAAREVFQCRTGVVAIETGESAPGTSDGIYLRSGEAVTIESGLTVHLRGVDGPALVNSTVVG